VISIVWRTSEPADAPDIRQAFGQRHQEQRKQAENKRQPDASQRRKRKTHQRRTLRQTLLDERLKKLSPAEKKIKGQKKEDDERITAEGV
jgi:hypothetical protein